MLRLGELLLRDGRLTQAQIDAAVAHQKKKGDRFGTALFDLGFLDADVLTVYLGLELGIPIATKAVLDRAKRAAVRLLTPETAEKFLCVPLVVQDRQLIAAVRDPHDLLALDELSSTTGYRIIPRVAPEVRLHYYVERYFGVPRPARFRALGDRPVEVRRATADTVEPPAPPLPGLPPVSRRPVTPPPLAAPMLKVVAPDDDSEELALELEADAAEVAEIAVPRAPDPPPAPAAAPPSKPQATIVEEPEPAAATGRETTKTLMADAETRGEVAELLLSFARGLFDVCVLLVVRDDLAIGWKGFGPDLDTDRIEALLVPLDSPSIFKNATDASDLFAGPAAPSALHGHLFKVLRAPAPAQAVVAPVMIRDRVVNFLYGHKAGDGQLSDEMLEAVKDVSRAAAEAYARLIALQKRQG